MEKRIEKQRLARKSNKEFLYDHFGSKCNACEETYIGVMSLDHVNGDGSVDRFTADGKRQNSAAWYASLVKRIKNGLALERELQMLCMNCHAKKDLLPWWLK